LILASAILPSLLKHLIITRPVENLEQVNGHLDPGQAKSITSDGSQDSPEFVIF